MRRRLTLLALAPAFLALPACASGGSEAPAAIFPTGVTPNGIYSPAVRVDDFIFLSGQIGTRDPDGPIADVAGQTRQALANIRNVLEAAGAGMDDVVKCSVFLADIRDYDAMNEVYRTAWPGLAPARTTVAVAGLPARALVEIECLARNA